MDSFLEKFFPKVYRNQKADSSTNQYCKFDSETLTMFTSSLYLAALASSLVASWVTRTMGRKLSMLFGGILFLAGALINGFAKAVWMLIVGRILLGFGIGFANQVISPIIYLFFFFLLLLQKIPFEFLLCMYVCMFLFGYYGASCLDETKQKVHFRQTPTLLSWFCSLPSKFLPPYTYIHIYIYNLSSSSSAPLFL